MSELSLSELGALKSAIAGELSLAPDDPLRKSLIENGFVRVQGDRLIITLSGHLRYLQMLSDGFE